MREDADQEDAGAMTRADRVVQTEVAAIASADVQLVASAKGDPWVLRLGNYLKGYKSAEPQEPWSVRLGNYLNEQKPGPWSLVANERPQDPLVRALTSIPTNLCAIEAYTC